MTALRRVLWLSVLMGGCQQEFSERPSARGELLDRIWTLRAMKGQVAASGDTPAATLRFLGDHRIAGTEDCNDVFSEDYRWSTDAAGVEGDLRPGVTGRTAVGCGTVTAIGRRFWHDMAEAHGWSIHGDRLTIRFSDGGQAMLTRTGPVMVANPDCPGGSTNFDCLRREDPEHAR